MDFDGPGDQSVDCLLGDEILDFEILLCVRIRGQIDATVRSDANLERRSGESSPDPNLEILDQRFGRLT